MRPDNVEAYLRDVARYCLVEGVAAQMEGFREGVSEVFPVGALAAFDADGGLETAVFDLGIPIAGGILVYAVLQFAMGQRSVRMR